MTCQNIHNVVKHKIKLCHDHKKNHINRMVYSFYTWLAVSSESYDSVGIMKIPIHGKHVPNHPPATVIFCCRSSKLRVCHNMGRNWWFTWVWVNYNFSLIWSKAIWEWFPWFTMIPRARPQKGNYNLPRCIYIYIYMYVIYRYVYIYIYS